jgi:electron transport complex protein RnfD
MPARRDSSTRCAITLNGVPPAYDAVASASLLGFAKTELSRGIDLAQSLLQAPAPGLYGSRPAAWAKPRPG